MGLAERSVTMNVLSQSEDILQSSIDCPLRLPRFHPHHHTHVDDLLLVYDPTPTPDTLEAQILFSITDPSPQYVRTLWDLQDAGREKAAR